MTKKIEEKEIKIEDETISKDIYIYIGETVANHRINIVKNSIINNLNNYKKIFKEIPGLENLFIKIKEYPEIKMRMKEKTSSINKRIKEIGKLMKEDTNV